MRIRLRFMRNNEIFHRFLPFVAGTLNLKSVAIFKGDSFRQTEPPLFDAEISLKTLEKSKMHLADTPFPY